MSTKNKSIKIGILGAGNVAQTLGGAWAQKGHQVCLGTRNMHAEKLIAWQKANGPTARLGSLQEAATFGEVVLLAINPWTEIKEVLSQLSGHLKGKIILDVSNNIEFGEKPKLAFTDRSMGEFVQELLPESHVVKTLNVAPAYLMTTPTRSGVIPAVGWVSGNDKEAKEIVSNLVKDLGWQEVVDLGDIHASLLQENIGLILTLVISDLMKQKK